MIALSPNAPTIHERGDTEGRCLGLSLRCFPGPTFGSGVARAGEVPERAANPLWREHSNQCDVGGFGSGPVNLVHGHKVPWDRGDEPLLA